MFKPFKTLNKDQRKYISSLLGIAGVAWGAPIYNLLVKLHLHKSAFSLEFSLTLIISSIISILAFLYGLKVLEDVK